MSLDANIDIHFEYIIFLESMIDLKQ